MNNLLQNYITEHKREDCCKEDKRKKITLGDGDSAKLTLSNPEKKLLYTVQVDGCLIDTVKQKKCDWIICLKGHDKTVMIELKSNSLGRKKTQDITMQFVQTRETLGLQDTSICCIIVTKSSFPKNGDKRQKLQDKMSSCFQSHWKIIRGKPNEESKISIQDLFSQN